MSDNQFNTHEVLAVAFAAYRINNGYLKFETYDYHKNIIEKYSNKDYVKGYYNKSVFKLVPKIEITDDDRQQVDHAVKFFQRYIFGVLKNNLTDFERDMFTAITAETVSHNQLGLIAYLPELYRREKNKTDLKLLIKQELSSSEYVGTIGENFNGSCIVLGKDYHRGYERFIYTVSYKHNILNFFAQFNFPVGSEIMIKGKIKNHNINPITKIKETKLNYVKTCNV